MHPFQSGFFLPQRPSSSWSAQHRASLSQYASRENAAFECYQAFHHSTRLLSSSCNRMTGTQAIASIYLVELSLVASYFLQSFFTCLLTRGRVAAVMHLLAPTYMYSPQRWCNIACIVAIQEYMQSLAFECTVTSVSASCYTCIRFLPVVEDFVAECCANLFVGPCSQEVFTVE